MVRNLNVDTALRCGAASLLLALALLFSSELCAASSAYPKKLRDRWAVAGALPGGGQEGCLLCHSKDVGGTGTATRAFATTLRTKYGLVGGDTDALVSALDQAKKKASDSDRDSFSDYEELAIFGTDPNDATAFPPPPPPSPPPSGAGGTDESGGAPGGLGGAPGAAGAPSEGGSPDEPQPTQCTPTETLYPSAQYGCQFGSGRASDWAFSELLACALIVQRVSARRTRRGSRRRGHQ